MRTFPDAVEKWRPTVQKVVEELLSSYPSRKSLIGALGVTIDGLVDTVLALIQKESSGNYLAIGDSGNSIGLMQLNYGAGTPQGEGFTGQKEDLKDPYTNIYFGSKYFLSQLARYQDIDKAILAYNAGSFRMNEAGSPINMDYLTNVLAFLGEKKTSFSWSRSSPAPGTGSDKRIDVNISLTLDEVSTLEEAINILRSIYEKAHPPQH